MATQVKFCGLTRPEDVDAAVALGVNAVGFVLVRASPRFITPGLAAIIRRRLPPTVRAVALLRNPTPAEVQEAVDAIRPDLLQFHGQEDAAACERHGLPYWRAVPMSEPQVLAQWERTFAGAEALLLDAHSSGGQGGTGRRFDWARVQKIAKPLVLAGGLEPGNVAEAIRTVRPWAVDVSSGIEASPGLKDREKMKQFMQQVRAADGH